VARKRRSAEEAKRLILEAAAERLRRDGPAALRLQDVAGDVGIAHPTVLHHFGSREGLVDAVVERSIRGLQADLLEALSTPTAADAASLLDTVSQVLSQRGQGRLLAWLILAQPEGEPFGTEATLEVIARAIQQSRVETVSLERARHVVLLAALTLFAESVAGPTMRRSVGLSQDSQAAADFRSWLARLIEGELAG
jgi:AcrR family transcriptional regulator